MTVIARAYESEIKAQEVAGLLLEKGLTNDRIRIVTPRADTGSAAAGLRAGKALGQYRDAEAYASALDKGQSIVIADVYFGTGATISKLMDDCSPATLDTVADLDDALHRSSPFSFTFGLPVLSRNNPAPFSTMFGLSTKTDQRPSFGTGLSKNSTPLSSFFGLPLLSRSGGTFFSRLGIKELHNETLGNSAMGIPLLTKNAAPLSSKLGIPCKSDNPAPFSSLYKIPLLSNQADDPPRQP